MMCQKTKDVIEPFFFDGHTVRVIVDDLERPLWVAKDVATALGYKDATNAVKRHCKGVAKHHPLQTAGGSQNVRVIEESDLYRLIVSSELETAQRFERVVFEEILPSIRRRGGYLTPEATERVLSDPDFIIRLATQLKEERERRAQLEEQQAIDAPKVLFANAVSTSTSTILVGELAKILKGNGINIGANRLFTWLRDNGFLISRKGTDWNTPTQKAMDLGLFKLKETAVTHSDGHVTISKTPKVTGKGQEYFISRFLNGQFMCGHRLLADHHAALGSHPSPLRVQQDQGL